MSQDYNNYINGTAAEKIEYDVYENNKVLREKKKYKTNSKMKLKAVFLCLIVFGACFLLMYRYAIITQMNNNIIEYEKNLARLQKENSLLRVEIEKALDIDQIQQIAENRLGMQKPDRSQIVYMNIQKSDSTVVLNTDDKTGSSGSFFASIAQKMGKFIRLLY